MTNFIVFFILGLICICVLFSSLMLFPEAFPILYCMYFITTASIMLYQTHKMTKEAKVNIDTLTKMKYMNIFNIIISSFLVIILGINMIPKKSAY